MNPEDGVTNYPLLGPVACMLLGYILECAFPC